MDTKLRRLQLTQLEILRTIDCFCSSHQIRYSLYAGTLLGAVRHKGFIPWDDDLDICMERSEYDRFLRIWAEEKPMGYLIQNKETTPSFTQSFTKVRKEHTTFLQEEWERGLYHTGICIDVFPVDRFPDGRLKRIRFRFDCLCCLLFTREFVPPKGSILEKMLSAVLLFCIRGESRERIRKQLLRRIKRYDDDRSLPMVTTETKAAVGRILPAGLMDDFIWVEFEDGEFMSTAQWDVFLRIKYDDYMTLPPESKRTWGHHPIILDFDHDYEELRGENNE